MNPQIQLMLSDPDTVIISLNQHSIMEPKVIGFSIYKLPKSLNETASPLFFKKTKSSVNSQYTNSRQVSTRFVSITVFLTFYYLILYYPFYLLIYLFINIYFNIVVFDDFSFFNSNGSTYQITNK